ncbi:GreA/GreB family elongation factor [Clostridium massiliamazoniense]|uniref:GreA/GreB family elongation factor n=1 Tax=Clostridium massiliamazoniense TaxID=1347366 RepID=UPI0006D770A0|nr:GreA/GreB family elongation factor [Clostridium massiliamazoniense]
MGINTMQGTPAYLEYIGPKGKKYRKNCYYNNGMCSNRKVNGYGCKCVVRFICGAYEERELREISYFECLHYRNLKCFNDKSALYLLSCCKNNNCADIVGKKKSYIHIEYGKDISPKNKKEKEFLQATPKIYVKNNLNQLIGKKYLLRDLQTNETFKVIFVKEKDKDELNDKFSINSPLARAILEGKNDIISLERNNVNLKYKIIGIS